MVDATLEEGVTRRLAERDLRGAATLALKGYGPQILAYLRATLPAPAIDDAFSEFCELWWKGLPGFRGTSSILTWSYQVAFSAARRILRDPFARRAQHLSTREMEALAQHVRSSTAVELRHSTSEQLARIRGKLDLDEHTLLILRVDRDLPWDDVATILGKDAAALRKRFERLKARIKKLAAETG